MQALGYAELCRVQGGIFYVSGCPHDCNVVCAYVVPSVGIPQNYFHIIDKNVGLYVNNLITNSELYWNTYGIPQIYLNQYNANFMQLTIYC